MVVLAYIILLHKRTLYYLDAEGKHLDSLLAVQNSPEDHNLFTNSILVSSSQQVFAAVTLHCGGYPVEA